MIRGRIESVQPGHYVQIWRHQQNRKYMKYHKNIATPSDEVGATAKGNILFVR